MLKWVKMFTFFIVRAEEVDPPHNQPDRKKVVILILPFNRVHYVKNGKKMVSYGLCGLGEFQFRHQLVCCTHLSEYLSHCKFGKDC